MNYLLPQNETIVLFLAKHLQGSNWKTLSIPRGQSDEFNRRMLAKLKADA